MARKTKRKINILIIIITIIMISILGGLSFYLYYDYNHRINISYICEIGTPVEARDLAMKPSIDATFVSTDNLDTTTPGIYDVSIKSGFFTYACQIIMVDTTPPTGTITDLDIMLGDSISANDFFTEINDASATTATFSSNPDFSKIGSSQVTILLKDNAYNTTTYQAMLTIHQQDDTPPVFHGATDFSIYKNENISYKSLISATDDIDGDIDFTVKGTVNNNETGEYPITLVATDWAQNTTTVDITVSVIESEYTQAEVDALADEVLAEIIKPDMSDLDKVKAIYAYITSHMGFDDFAEKGDWIKAAYLGLSKHTGDCYTYAATAKELLTRAGINNRDISKIPTPHSSHYWNLVDIGEGWHHFDTTPRKDHPNLCYLSDQELMEYSTTHWNSHNYDKNIYNDIP